MSLKGRKNAANFEVKFNLDELELTNLADLVGKEITVQDGDWVPCSDGKKRLALKYDDKFFTFASSVFEDFFGGVIDEAGEDYEELKKDGFKIKVIQKKAKKSGRDFYDFEAI